MELHYPLWLHRQVVNTVPGRPVWVVVSARDSAARELRYGRFSQRGKEAPILYTDISRRMECAQITPRPRQTRVFDVLAANGDLSGSVSLARGNTLQCTFYDAAVREIGAVYRAPEAHRNSRAPIVYTLAYHGAVVWRLEYRLLEGVLRIESVQPFEEGVADFMLSGLCAVIAYQRV